MSERTAAGKPQEGAMSEPRSETLADIAAEVVRARTKFPINRHTLTALVEEVGELAQALIQRQGPDRIYKEAMQVAAVAVRMMEEGDASHDDVTDCEAQR